ncbi:hypothetical protein IC607_09930 [Cellulomonas sp. JH27-2]|uniref:hypothetical protein n=1 Tax=Cellulomonas sp. JH27-2 TaxID=2774139 RepID=UPI00177AAA3C|nr:hypothetical protein [Cellulomonas sp. JH27-2]MBD8059284.1 hypothetical protein [Cellulomonas sp. JH27-2]
MGKPKPAALEIRVLPWRPRRRKIKPDDLREMSSDAMDFADGDDSGVVLVVGILVTVLVFVFAPIVAVVLSIMFLPVEAGLVLVLGALVIVARFTGVIPWTVLVLTPEAEEHERFRLLHRAVRRVRELNGGGRPPVVWRWV